MKQEYLCDRAFGNRLITILEKIDVWGAEIYHGMSVL